MELSFAKGLMPRIGLALPDQRNPHRIFTALGHQNHLPLIAVGNKQWYQMLRPILNGWHICHLLSFLRPCRMAEFLSSKEQLLLNDKGQPSPKDCPLLSKRFSAYFGHYFCIFFLLPFPAAIF